MESDEVENYDARTEKANEMSEEDETESEEEESEEEDEDYQPEKKKTKMHLLPPEDYNGNAFYDQGLSALASIVAYKVKNKLPEYVSAENSLPTNYPVWIEHFSETGMSPPTGQLLDYVRQMDRKFHNIHGESVLKDSKLVQMFVDHMQVSASNIPTQLVRVFIKLRILVRVRALNKRNNNQKKDAANKAKFDKDCRQAEVNKVWAASKIR